MATYKRENGSKWVIPVLIALIALLALGYLLYQNRDKAKGVASTAATAATSPSASSDTIQQPATLTDLASFLATTNLTSVADRTVDFKDALVKRVTGDKTFSVGTTGSELVYAVLSPQLNDNAAAEQNLQVKEGQTLHIVGTVKIMPALADIKSKWSLNDQEAADAQKFGVYIEATSATVQ